MNQTPRWVRRVVVVCVAIPAALVRIGSILLSSVAWGATITGIAPHPAWSGLPVFIGSVVVGILAYFVVVGVDFFTAEFPHSVATKRIVANIVLELGVQLLVVACFCLLVSGAVASSPGLGVAGLITGIAAVILGCCSQGRIKAWKEAWNPGSTAP